MKNIIIRSLRAKQEGDLGTAEKFFEKPKNKLGDIKEEKRSKSKFRRLINFIVFFVFVLVVGGAGGILTDRFAIPYLLVNYPQLNQYEFLKQVNERTTIVEITKEVEISEDKAVVEAVKSVLPSIVQIVESMKDVNGELSGEFARKGTGVILTNDGVIITSAEIISIVDEDEVVSEKEKEEIEGNIDDDVETDSSSDLKRNLSKVKLSNGKIYSAELIAEDVSTGFAIIKIEESNLPVLAFAAFDNIELGEKVIALDDSVVVDIISKFIDGSEATENGVEKGTKKRIKIMNSLDESFNGAPVVNLKREIIGISQGGDMIVLMDEIAAFANEAMSK